ncbi:LacI family DNA-binding transcriptional regulator [Arthrobacter sp. NEB 688]|uniref:LacI family DNA-binding transcriptional regulator n=1 Tax=Arthrobacter sp. NEB 688 TaxID=904039 RepID=UPI0015646864|nr:LacI family DNA-binding transcriptional regulator [Arthrobacter sp. NEB 688]QKE85580.1 LacI family DNA-binding transcriptional regulator [Arthrobacter sp. NEB 688]
MSRPTIYDVARESGVSIKTVSRVINDAPNVRPATLARVRSAIDLLGYQPDPAAQRLGGGRLPTVGVVVDSIADPFFARFAAVVEARATAVGMDVLIASTGLDEDRLRTQVERLARRGVAGLVVAPFGDAASVAAALPSDLPVVVVDRPYASVGADAVRVTDEPGAHEAVHHLLDHGHLRIGFVGRTGQFATLADRYRGYERALHEAGVEVDPALVETRAWTTDEALPLVTAMLTGPDAPTAVFAATPMTGLAVLTAQQRLDRRDVALVVFGDLPGAELMTPPTTVVDQQPDALADTAFDLLERRLREPSAEPLDSVLPTRLVRRGSGELRPGGAS